MKRLEGRVGIMFAALCVGQIFQVEAAEQRFSVLKAGAATNTEKPFKKFENVIVTFAPISNETKKYFDKVETFINAAPVYAGDQSDKVLTLHDLERFLADLETQLQGGYRKFLQEVKPSYKDKVTKTDRNALLSKLRKNVDEIKKYWEDFLEAKMPELSTIINEQEALAKKAKLPANKERRQLLVAIGRAIEKAYAKVGSDVVNLHSNVKNLKAPPSRSKKVAPAETAVPAESPEHEEEMYVV